MRKSLLESAHQWGLWSTLQRIHAKRTVIADDVSARLDIGYPEWIQDFLSCEESVSPKMVALGFRRAVIPGIIDLVEKFP
jgi:hypothetical protein